jgi:inner membrane transporter RhtA
MTTPRDVLKAAGLVSIGSLGVQISAAVSVVLFTALGPFEVSSLRMLVAAIVLLVVFRPSLRGRSRTEWTGIVLYGVAMAAMNVALYLAIDRIPLGIAVTLEFLGPTAVALASSRRLPEFLCAALALGGVALLSFGPGGHVDPLGYGFALLAGVFFAAYAVLSSRVGKASGGSGRSGYSGLALSVAVASLITLPWGAPHIPDVTQGQWALVAVSAILGVAIPFTVDTIAGGLTSPRVVGTLFALDPVVGSLVGLAVLNQHLAWTGYAGIVLVAAAGALLVWSAERKTPETHPEAP